MRNLPFLLSPIGKDYLWGGSRLNDDFNLNLPLSPLAEAWMCSTHPHGQTIIASGEWRGHNLAELLGEHPELLGSHAVAVGGGQLPILIKLIDAKANLSVQVHPDDVYAEKTEHCPGKTEMWYVLDAKPGSTLVYGFNRNVTAEEVQKKTEDGTVDTILNHVPIQKNDLFYIEAGTVHALGSGALVAEIQENSNITYRLYDYGRGRETHIQKALDVAKLEGSDAPRQPMRVLKYKKGAACELLCRCKYFQVERILLNTEGRKMPEFHTDNNSFHVLLITDGCGVLFCSEITLPFFKGDCIFVPADSIQLHMHGRAQILNVSC